MKPTLFLCALLIPVLGAAEPKFQWSGKSVTGREVRVPTGEVSILLFVRANHAQSREVLDNVKKLAAAADLNVIIIASDPKHLIADWPIVADPTFDLSGKFNVHVWPTTVVVKPDGTRAAHLAGASDSFAADLHDYVEFARGAIDESELASELATHQMVQDGSSQKADRRLAVAVRLLENGQLDEAKAQIDEGLSLRPDDPKLSAMMARVLLLQNQPAEALTRVETLSPGAVPAWQIELLRGRALVALDRWEEARAAAPKALDLNPQPAEAHYLLGLIHQHDAKWQDAAEEFRKAYESRQLRR